MYDLSVYSDKVFSRSLWRVEAATVDSVIQTGVKKGLFKCHYVRNLSPQV